MFDFGSLKRLNWMLILTMMIIIAIGIVVITSASHGRGINYAVRQLIWLGVGLCGFVIASCFEYRKLKTISWYLYAFIILALIFLALFGKAVKGSSRWFEIEFLNFKFQPSEFAKLAIIIALATYLDLAKNSRKALSYTLVALCICAVPMFLIVMQPNLGTALILIPLLFGMLFFAGARAKYVLVIILIGLLAAPVLWMQMKPYQKLRIIQFLTVPQKKFMLNFVPPQERKEILERLDPSGSKNLDEALETMGRGWNARQSMIAVGSGGLFGNGWMSGSQTRLAYLSDAHTDFIFAVLCEEWGFMGSFIVLALYFVLLATGLKIASEAVDNFGRLIATGITILLASQIIINVAMSIGLIPITGLPLPLLSYGGSSLLTTMLCLGILESIHARRHYFKSEKYHLG